MLAGRICPAGISLPMCAPQYQGLATLKPRVYLFITPDFGAVWIPSYSNDIAWRASSIVIHEQRTTYSSWCTTNWTHENNMICANLANRNPVKERDPTCEWTSKIDLSQFVKDSVLFRRNWPSSFPKNGGQLLV